MQKQLLVGFIKKLQTRTVFYKILKQDFTFSNNLKNENEKKNVCILAFGNRFKHDAYSM